MASSFVKMTISPVPKGLLECGEKPLDGIKQLAGHCGDFRANAIAGKQGDPIAGHRGEIQGERAGARGYGQTFPAAALRSAPLFLYPFRGRDSSPRTTALLKPWR